MGSGSLYVVLADICGRSLIFVKLLVGIYVLLEGLSDLYIYIYIYMRF